MHQMTGPKVTINYTVAGCPHVSFQNHFQLPPKIFGRISGLNMQGPLISTNDGCPGMAGTFVQGQAELKKKKKNCRGYMSREL